METPRLEDKILPTTVGQITRIESQVAEWQAMEEHWTKYNLDRRIQLEKANTYCRRILATIKELYTQGLSQGELRTLAEAE